MKNKTFKLLKIALACTTLLAMTLSCERDLSDDATLATFSKSGEIFTDSPVGLGADFYFPYADSKFTAFSVDNETGFDSQASIRIDVPNADDPLGNYAGGIFRIDGAGRDLTGFDALTFYAKASQGVSVGEIGFGEDFLENKFIATRTNISVGTSWTKYIIPIPDPSKLTQERGMLRYSMGTQDTNGSGYTFWIDEIKFEKLGTIAQARPSIVNGADVTVSSFIGVASRVTELRQTFNTAAGDVSVVPAPSYFEFNSSNPGVASVDLTGLITTNSSGTAVITAKLAGIDAAGSIAISSLGNFQLAPTPTRNPNNVKSIFSDFYTNVPVDFFNGFWQPFQTTLSADFQVNGDNILNYTNFNFVGNQFANPTIDATNTPNLHLNMYIPSSVPNNLDFLISIVDFGPDRVDGGGDDTRQQVFFNRSNFVADTWSTLEIPITLANKNNLGLLIYENVNGSPLRNFYLDNIYFYGTPVAPTTPTIAAPTPTTPAANVISLFSGAYSNVPVDTFRTPWSVATFQDVNIAGNATKEYANLDFVGIETVTNQINATSMTHFRIDTWSSNYTSFSVKLVDFGPNGVFGGGDDTEHQVNINSPGQSQWVSHDIPLSSFTGLTARSNIAQYILVAQPTGTAKVYVDNMYFRN